MTRTMSGVARQEAALPVQVGLGVLTNYRLAELRSLLTFGRAAGIDSYLVSDHWQDFIPRTLWKSPFSWRATMAASPHEYRESFTMLGMLAGSAGRVRIGTAVTETVRRHPVMVAQAALTLAEGTKRPPILGVGAGEELNIAPYGMANPRPASRVEEALKVIRRCWESAGPFDFEGEHYSLDGALLDLPAPGGRTPEIWVAGNRPQMLRITGELGDGWLPTSAPIGDPSGYETAWKTVRSAAEAAGRDPKRITPSLFAYAVIAPTSSMAESLLRTELARYLALVVSPADWWADLGEPHPLGPEYRGYVDAMPEEIEGGRIRQAIERIPPEIVRSCYVFGTTRKVESTIHDYADAGLRHIVLAPVSALIRARHQYYALSAIARLVRRLRQ